MKGGGISLKGILLLLLYYLRIILALPFALLQWLFYRKQIKNTIISKDPVFILGHYRCGTTFLQKLMTSDVQFGYLTNYDALFPNTNLLFGKKMERVSQRMITIFKIKNPFFNNSIVLLSEPTEEDDYLMNKASAYSAYWGLVFPKRWREWLNGTSQFSNQTYFKGWKDAYLTTLKYATFKNKGKQLVLKSPPNTERIPVLLEMFPQAKFIFICRNPYHVYYSTKNIWERAILNYYSLQEFPGKELDELIFNHYIYLNDKYLADKELIPDGNLIEISYEELKADPFNTIQRIYSRLDLPGFEMAAKDFFIQLDSEKEYRNFEYPINDITSKEIHNRWRKYIELWNYNTI